MSTCKEHMSVISHPRSCKQAPSLSIFPNCPCLFDTEGREQRAVTVRCSLKGVAPSSFFGRAEHFQKLKKKNSINHKKHEERGQPLLLSQPITMRKIQGSHKRSKTGEMQAEKLIMGGKHCQVSEEM